MRLRLERFQDRVPVGAGLAPHRCTPASPDVRERPITDERRERREEAVELPQ